MRSKQLFAAGAALIVGGLAATTLAAQAQDRVYPHKPLRHYTAAANDSGDRPLTIGRRRQPSIIQISPNEVYAPGGFSAHSWHPNFAQREEMRKEARNQFIRQATSGIYGYGGDGLGGTGLTDFEGGYNNPSYGGEFNQYVGYNGVPTDLSFGPAFAFRHLTDPEDDDADAGSPSPAQLGYTPATKDDPEY